MLEDEFDGTEERRIRCVMCREPIAYPPAMEGNEIPCPHCQENILLLMSSTVMFRKGELEADRDAYEAAMKAKAEKEAESDPIAPTGKRIQVKTSEDTIPHLIEPVQLVDGIHQSPTNTHLLHPHRFVIWKGGLAITRKPDMISVRWSVIQDQGAKGRPVPELTVTARLKEPTDIGGINFDLGNQSLPCDLNGEPSEEKGILQFSGQFPDDRFLQLCRALAEETAISVTVSGPDTGMSDKLQSEFRDYTLEFYEALRRRFGYFFK